MMYLPKRMGNFWKDMGRLGRVAEWRGWNHTAFWSSQVEREWDLHGDTPERVAPGTLQRVTDHAATDHAAIVSRSCSRS